MEAADSVQVRPDRPRGCAQEEGRQVRSYCRSRVYCQTCHHCRLGNGPEVPAVGYIDWCDCR